eukprot:TRINITY_DN2984_c0_g1_i1.p1 TRINITY_DN2984_c0_g1~~TRINITY_DN2984_c0_g1_i1.p1  ORF type:complete len:421 (+),score=52.55 TRINITY_DN2984_c0_g1_i1:151-1263(+)
MSLLFSEATYCFNTSVYLESVCYNHGLCPDKADAECVCSGQYVKETFCFTTISEELNYANIPLYITFAVAYSILIVLVTYDFLVDIKLKGFSLGAPIIFGNITLFFSCVSLLISFIISYIEHKANTNIYSNVVKTLGFFSEFLMLTSYSIATLSWISVILTAKGLGEGLKGLAIYRMYVLVTNVIMLILYFFSGVLGLLFNSTFFVTLRATISVIVFFVALTLIFGTSVFILKAFRWVRSLDTAERTPAIERAQLKSSFLVGVNVSTSFNIIFWIFGAIYGTTTAKFHLYRLFLHASEIVILIFLLLILEKHILRLPLYIRTGKIRPNALAPQGFELLNSNPLNFQVEKEEIISRAHPRLCLGCPHRGIH